MITDGEDAAFACTNDMGNISSDGLTKREYFAAFAMQGLLANEYLSSSDRLEKHAVEHADRLIKELNKSVEEEQ